jgi:hypothetical protein
MEETSMTTRRLLLLALVLLAVPSHAAQYQIEVIAEFPSGVLLIGESIGINQSGQVGFLVSRFVDPDLLYDAYRGDAETPVVAVAVGIDGFSQAGASSNSSIDGSGAVYLTGRVLPAGPAGVLAGDGNSVTARVSLTASLYNFVGHDSNDAGQVAFIAGSPTGFTLQRREANGELSAIAAHGAADVDSFGANQIAINEAGTVASYLQLDDGTRGIGRGAPGTYGAVVTEATGFVPQSYFLDIDGAGSVVFLATPAGGSTGGALYTTAGGAFVDSAGPFANFLDVACSENGRIAFQANRDGADIATTGGIYTGADPIADKVFAVGDAFVASTVSRIRLGDINDAGQIAFLAEVLAGRDFVLRATPVPEPGAALGALVALAALARSSRSRNRR